MTDATEKPTELTVTQTMLRLGKSNKTIHNMIVDGRLKARVAPGPNKYYLITIESIESYELKQKESDQAAT